MAQRYLGQAYALGNPLSRVDMELVVRNGMAMRLSIASYAYPGIENGEHYDPYSEDFLNVAIQATTPRGTWQATKPALLTMELRELAKWLNAISRGATPGEKIEFFDPLLYFEYGGERDGLITVRIGFGLGFRPPWAEKNQVDAEEFLFDFEVTREDLKSAASSLAAESASFPTRWKPSKKS